VTDQDKADCLHLLSLPSFCRLINLHAIQNAGVFAATANGSDGRNLYLEGRRSLGLEILRYLDEAQPVASPDGIPVLTVMQVFREAAQSQPMEKPSGRRTDIYRDLDRDQPDG